ncbi:hypothetical protein HF325_002951 [Metschnikowia pulcherrima]|uniref:Uncharacterized protein n=1 Tax=Metschnikowia pulcherrima TaxID=27326 RepID=A0A8H7GT80_9ASCO|nr:hypothetical protein HF325_002951 [Metschnikowia pulcherrima]
MHENTNLFAKINQNSKNADVGFATPPSPQKSALALPSTTSMSVSSREKMKIDFLDNAPDDMRANEVVQELEGFKEDLANFQLALEQLRSSTAGNGSVELYDEDGTEDVYIPTEFLAGFGFPYFSNLDKDGMIFLECYREQYSTFVLIGTETLNYFLKTFLSIAASNEGITYALTAWGGFFLELRKPRSDFTKPWEYMQKATRCMCSQMGDYLRPNDKSQFYELFAFYLIFIGIEVCTGDVRNWRGFMTQCLLLIQSYGGILKVLDLFGYSNDIKWLISDFKFHDLLSSKCLIDGPIFLVEDYMKALEPRPEYGIDPLQGIVGPLYDIIGRIGTAKADLARKWAQVKYNVQAQDSDAEQITASYYDTAQQMIDNLKAQIASCKPLAVHMDLLADDEEDRKLHLALFELHVHICRLQLATLLERMPPNTITQQYSLHKALPLIDYLQATKLKVSLSLLLLVCGMTCCAPHDRALMTRRFRLHVNQYEIGNLQRIEETVVGAWECNPTGAVCIDWAEFVRDKEWHLYVG